jgi:hypothetical protein
MRKTAIAGVAALGLLTVGFTVMGHPASYDQAKAEGGHAGVRVTRHSRLAMLAANQPRRKGLAADPQSASPARSLPV